MLIVILQVYLPFLSKTPVEWISLIRFRKADYDRPVAALVFGHGCHNSILLQGSGHVDNNSLVDSQKTVKF